MPGLSPMLQHRSHIQFISTLLEDKFPYEPVCLSVFRSVGPSVCHNSKFKVFVYIGQILVSFHYPLCILAKDTG